MALSKEMIKNILVAIGAATSAFAIYEIGQTIGAIKGAKYVEDEVNNDLQIANEIGRKYGFGTPMYKSECARRLKIIKYY